MIDALKPQLTQLADRIDALSVRERGIIFVAGLMLLFMLFSNVVFGPLRTEQAQLEQALTTKRNQLNDIDRQINTAVSGGTEADTMHRAKLAALRQQLTDLDSQMDRMTAGVVSPKEMARLVEQMLTRGRGLELVKLEALPSMPIGEEANASGNATPAANSGATMYRHAMRIELKGRYFDIVEYLKALESLQWKVFWGEVTLETDKYPFSKVSLVIYTLSRYPGWIGV
jgi:MSHA biogenesis protein MshJ